MIARFSDHGDLGLSHGGLRQKMFNAYEETMRVPLVISNPLLFPGGATSDGPVSLVDLVPTLLSLSGGDAGEAVLDGHDLAPVLERHAAPDREALARVPVDFGSLASGDAAGSDAVRDDVLFTYKTMIDPKTPAPFKEGYLLVKDADLDRAIAALREAGHDVAADRQD